MIIEQEKRYLRKVEDILDRQITKMDLMIGNRTDDLLEDRRHIWNTFAEMDEIEQAAVQNEAHIKTDILSEHIRNRHKLEKQKDSPFWGKVLFKEENSPNTEGIYIGIGTIADDNETLYVVDWRAPVGDLFYNFELGEGQYKAPAGTIKGKIKGKVQHKIKNGELLYAIDTTTTITDEILIHELAKNASPIMKNIAATIQKEQNEVIRYPIGENILVQGVAGSGKTSIALHRVAYLLYNARKSIRAKDIMIISPNRAFSGYISNVLPELGESNVEQMSFEALAVKELTELCTFERRTSYLEDLYNGAFIPEDEIADMRYKASEEFVKDIKSIVKFAEKKTFKPRNFVYKDYCCDKETFNTLFFKRYAHVPCLKRIPMIIDYVEQDMMRHFRLPKNPNLHIKLTELLNPMFRRYSSLDIYKVLLQKLKEEGKPVIVPDINEELPFEDVYGLLLLKVLYEGTKEDYSKYKHLVVDEMQDYVPTQYAIINYLFKCPKDILGDMNQIVDPYMNIGSLETMGKLMGDHKFFSLETSYRSSAEIIEFANQLTDQHINSIERHEEKPQIVKCENIQDEAKKIIEEVNRAINERGFGSVAIIARNREQALALYQEMKGTPICLLLDSQTKYQGGIILTTSVIVKGFEFDEVIIADANSENYSTDADRHIMFVACTRALHVLKLFYTGEQYKF